MTIPCGVATLRRGLRPLLWCVTALALAGCAGTPAEPQADARQETVAEILSQPLDASEYGTPRRCISNATYQDYEAVGDDYVVFKGAGNKLWLNEVHGLCPGLKRSSSLAFRQQGMQLCELDQFKVVDWFTWSRYERSPWHWLEGVPCTLGRFQPITPDQLEALRAAER